MKPENNTGTIIVRYPPSPTGKLHVGNARTALFNFLFAKKNGGKLIVRMEDTDRERSKPEYEQDILDNLTWLGISWDNENIWKQSERTEVYKKYLQKLIDEGKAYISQESEGANKEVVRFKNPNKDVTFHDLIRGDVTFNTEELKDFIIARNINEPIYHLAVVIDDFEAGVTHVIRGDDGISNTPRQILIQEAIDAPRPIYAHVPLVLAKDKTKLSKRKHGESVSLDYYKQKGFLPEALANFLALIGWNPGTDQEIFTLSELIEVFDIEKVQKGGGVFDEIKLRHINKEHLKKLPEQELRDKISAIFSENQIPVDPEMLSRAYHTIMERLEVWSDLHENITNGEYAFMTDDPILDVDKMIWKDADKESTKAHLQHAKDIIEEIEIISSPDEIKNLLWNYAEEKGKGAVLWPLRYALTGKDKSPDPFTLIYILQKEVVLQRITRALERI
ncbi:MAG: glutamate--tRNA ligase [Candidatus Zambryskibacteria bacterium CG10_big_fil_rev_8_21_14_0_10_42_12]|uniref:Glutamate--tRNA ligase n=1 Tax=Candidatus Zambryskibacteria bacterium CG10_big_fil_rev_8_21_14_0_10_42_12 TaxID=1975115 RepID=A0A2H0QVY4_9BACT|nr:MAG: glutamate--tRNA ligase [Candidatus Zambryskibacteria bacterium CG10_big_fil_rev_8_21_14_0_10_42_12]